MKRGAYISILAYLSQPSSHFNYQNTIYGDLAKLAAVNFGSKLSPICAKRHAATLDFCINAVLRLIFQVPISLYFSCLGGQRSYNDI